MQFKRRLVSVSLKITYVLIKDIILFFQLFLTNSLSLSISKNKTQVLNPRAGHKGGGCTFQVCVPKWGGPIPVGSAKRRCAKRAGSFIAGAEEAGQELPSGLGIFHLAT